MLKIKNLTPMIRLNGAMRSLTTLAARLCGPACPWGEDELQASPAFDAGLRASEDGDPKKNPHRKGSLEWHAWSAGWEYGNLLARQW